MSIAWCTGRVHMDAIEQEGGSRSNHGQSGESSEEKEVKEKIQTTNHSIQEEKPNSIRGTRPAPLQILDRVKMNNTVETPCSTIKGFLNPDQLTALYFTRENLKRVEQKLKKAFIEFYHKLCLLKSYRYKYYLVIIEFGCFPILNLKGVLHWS